LQFSSVVNGTAFSLIATLTQGGAPAPAGIMVSFSSGGGIIGSHLTGNNGIAVTTRNFPPGTYTCTAAAPGYGVSNPVTVTITNDSNPERETGT
jgi:hypothetical protein